MPMTCHHHRHHRLTRARGGSLSRSHCWVRCSITLFCTHLLVHFAAVPSSVPRGAQQRHKNAANIVTFLLCPLAYPITIRDPCVWNEIIRKDCAFVSHAGVERANNNNNTPYIHTRTPFWRRAEDVGGRFFCFISVAVHKAVISV